MILAESRNNALEHKISPIIDLQFETGNNLN